MKKLLSFLDKLEENNIYYRLNKVREAIMVEIAVPGERWEVEFFADGQVEAEEFTGGNEMLTEREFEKVLKEWIE